MTRRWLRAPLARDIAVAAALLWLLTILATIAVVAVPGARHAVRSGLAFALTPYEGSASELVDIAVTNARVVLALALAAWVGSRVPDLRLAADLVAGLIVIVNAALVGTAFGAYGAAAVPWLVHLPVEWGALAVVLALHRSSRRRILPAHEAVVTTAIALALVGVGALGETYLTPQQ